MILKHRPSLPVPHSLINSTVSIELTVRFTEVEKELFVCLFILDCVVMKNTVMILIPNLVASSHKSDTLEFTHSLLGY